MLSASAGNPEVNIASGALFNGRANVHPNMLLSLSVEFPTVGIAYRGDNGTYNRTVEYAGYFNPLKCYAYNGGNRNLADAGNLATDGYFYILKDADKTTHECGGSFSGNFMNWASSSSIDMLRYALTGGDRVYDKPGATILQRAVLRDGDADNFYANTTYFPRRSVTASGNVSAPKQVTPFDVKTLYVVSCRNRILFSDESSGLNGDRDSKTASTYCVSVFDVNNKGKTETLDKKLGEYLVRVKVCDGSEGTDRKDLCQKYGNGYKPAGEIQRNAEKIRLAAMGYLLDDSETRYGGVLRAPMKYVGAKKREAPDFIEVGNDRPEWNPDTGVFYNNPEDPANPDGATNSGVINYLNKFGRSAKYKRYDPVSELYYEGIRYFQGKAPTADATANMTAGMSDEFPVSANWTDPVIASCQKNYIVSIADVNTHWDRYIPGNERTTFNGSADAHDNKRAPDAAVAGKTPAFDIKTWTKKVGELENDANNSSKNTTLTNLDAKDTGSGGHGTYYMAGAAYWANTNDIRLDKPVRVKTFTIDVDEGGNGLIDGNTRGGTKPRDSQLYLAAKYGGFDDRNGDGNPYVTVAEDGTTEVKGTNLEWDYNGNGVPPNYFLASQPKEMIQAIRKVFARIGDSSGTISGVSASTTKISAAGAYIYQPGFNSSTWSGSLKRISIALENEVVKIKPSAADWDAGVILTGTRKPDGSVLTPAEPTPQDRKIYTAQFNNRQLTSTIEFKWSALTATQKALLDVSPADGSNDGLGQKRVEYLRGDRSLERGKTNGVFRVRERVLGDIINSNPTYVGAPATNVQGDGYQDFRDKYSDNGNKKGRVKAVYVGANDGMLHAFEAESGKELFAYVPDAVIKDLNRLTLPEYVHQPYVDGMMTVAEAQVNGNWKTVLASGMGGGAQGVFALDVTDPANFAGGSGALFEFTDADDMDMGNLMGTPLIARFRTKTTGGIPEYKYFVVVPSGLNNYKDDGSGKFSTTGEGVLFLLSLDKASSATWQEGVNYFKFKVPNTDTALPNGLSTPALAVGIDGAVRYAYAGDLQGNLWRFDFTANGVSSAAGAGSIPLYTAKDARSVRQPITMQPKVVFAPGGGYVVLFGTGKFVEDIDAAPGYFKPQSFYGIYDIFHDANGSAFSVSGRDKLAQRTLEKNSGTALTITGEVFSYGVERVQKQGWYFDFLDAEKTGERSVTNPLLAYGNLFFNSLIPGGDPCSGGGGRTYTLNGLTGLPSNGGVTGLLSTVGMPSSPVRLEFGVDVSDRNAIGRRSVKKKQTIVNFGTDGAASAETSESILRAGRFSWREIFNWQELRNAIKAK